MTVHTLIVIILAFWASLLVIGLFVAVFFLGRSSIKKNDENSALVLVKVGHEIKAYKGKLFGVCKSGIGFIYNRSIAIVPFKFKRIFHKNRLLIFMNNQEQVISSPFDNDEKLTDEEKKGLIYELFESHLGADAIRALKGKGQGLLTIIIVGIVAFALGAILVYGVINLQSKKPATQPVSHPTQSQNNQLPAPIEVK